MKRIFQHPLFILLTASAFAGLLLTNVLAQSAPDIEAPVFPTFSALEIGESQVSDKGVLFLISSDSVATFGVQAVIGAGSLAQSIGAYGMSQNNIGIVSEVSTTAARGEGYAYGVYATGKISGIVANSSSVGTHVSGAVEATGDTLGILGYGTTAGVEVTSDSQVSALGYEKDGEGYGLYTDGKIVLDGSFASVGTVNVSNGIILPSMGVYGSADINSLNISAWKSSDAISWEADNVNFALGVSDLYYFIIENADSEIFPLSIGGDLIVGQANPNISSVSEFELSPGLEVKQSLHSTGKITANEIGSFYTVQNGPSATATAQCSVGELVGCTGVVYEGEGALKQAGSPQSGQCKVSSTDSATKVLAYAYCFDPEGNGASGALTALPNSDSDSWPDFQDNCPNVANEDQVDSDNDGEGDACHGTSCPDFTSPPTVTKDNTNQRFSISWDDIWGSNPYEYNYEIYYDTTTKKDYDSTASTSLTLPYYEGYSDSKSYTFKVRTFEEMNSEPVCYGNWSSVAFQHCPPPYIPSPTAGISGNTISVSWSAVPGADSYCYYIFGDSEDATSTQETCNTGGTSQIYNTNEFESGYTYTFNVRAKNTSCSSNQYSGWGSTDFSLDENTPPTGTININSGATYTTSTSVTLTLSCSDSDGCSKMRFSANNSSWSSEENYSTSKSYTLSSGDGTKYVYVQFKDNAGNWSTQSISDSITLDTTSPNAPTVSGTSPTSDTTPTWSWTSGGGGNGNYRYKLDNSDLSSGTTSTTSTSYIPSSALSSTSHTLYVQEKDDAGNWSASGSKSITIQSCSTPGTPSPSVSRVTTGNGGYKFSWSAVSGATAYYYYLTDETGAVVYGTNDSKSTTGTSVTITYDLYSFTFDTSNDSYTFYVAAYNSCGKGDYGSVTFRHPIVADPDCVDTANCAWVDKLLVEVVTGTREPWHWWVNRGDIPCTINCGGVRATDCGGTGGYCPDNIPTTTSLVDVLTHTNSLLKGWDGEDVTGDMTSFVGAYLVTEGIITGTDVGNISDASIANAINGILDTLGYFETQAGNTYTSDFNTQATITGKTLIQTGGY